MPRGQNIRKLRGDSMRFSGVSTEFLYVLPTRNENSMEFFYSKSHKISIENFTCSPIGIPWEYKTGTPILQDRPDR